MSWICSVCVTQNNDRDRACSLCKNAYVPSIIDDDSEPVNPSRKGKDEIRKIPKIPIGVLAVVISAVVAVAVGVIATRLFLEEITPERIALDGFTVLLNADFDEYVERHAFVETEIGLLLQTNRAASRAEATEYLIWQTYNDIKPVFQLIEENDIRISVASYEELTDAGKDSSLENILYTIEVDPDDDPARIEMIESILNNVERLFRIDIDVLGVGVDASPEEPVSVYIGSIDDQKKILSIAMR